MLMHKICVHFATLIKTNLYYKVLTTGLCESQPILTGGASTAFFPFDLLLASCAARRERWNDSFSTVGDAVPSSRL